MKAFVWLVLATSARAEVYSSAANMKEIFRIERDMVHILETYSSKLEQRLRRINDYMKVRESNVGVSGRPLIHSGQYCTFLARMPFRLPPFKCRDLTLHSRRNFPTRFPAASARRRVRRRAKTTNTFWTAWSATQFRRTSSSSASPSTSVASSKTCRTTNGPV